MLCCGSWMMLCGLISWVVGWCCVGSLAAHLNLYYKLISCNSNLVVKRIVCTLQHSLNIYDTNLLYFAQLQGSLVKAAYHQTYWQWFTHFRANISPHSLHPPLPPLCHITRRRFSANGYCMNHDVAVCYSVLLQCVAVWCCRVLQCDWVLQEPCLLQCVTVYCCGVLQCVLAVCCSANWSWMSHVYCSLLQSIVAVCCSILFQCCSANGSCMSHVCCSVLPCIAVVCCTTLLQCIAVRMDPAWVMSYQCVA